MTNKNKMTNKNIAFLFDYCSKEADLYNLVAYHLNKRFGITSAEITLLVTYYVSQERKGCKND